MRRSRFAMAWSFFLGGNTSEVPLYTCSILFPLRHTPR
jgi:hypothetical protein